MSNENGPGWSPDGKKISFHRRVSTSQLWVMSAAGENPVLLGNVDVGYGRKASWSPDGKEIAFITGAKGRITEVTGSSTGADIWKMPASGGTPVQVTRGGFAASIWNQVRWAPDGREIAFISSKGGNPNIWTVTAAGGTPQQVTLLSGRKVAMSFSPDSRRLAFALGTDGNWDIWTVPATGGTPQRLVDWPTTDVGPEWSPDGKRVAFFSDRTPTGEDGNSGHIWIAPLDGGEPTYLNARGLTLLVSGRQRTALYPRRRYLENSGQRRRTHARIGNT